jgi:hypothetical protein
MLAGLARLLLQIRIIHAKGPKCDATAMRAKPPASPQDCDESDNLQM